MKRFRGWGRWVALGLFAFSSGAAGAAFIPASNRVDMVHDATRNVLYISTVSNGVLRYSFASNSFLTPLPMIGQLRGLAISPDDRWLAAADAMRDGTNAWIHLADLQAETNRRVLFPRGSGEGGTYSVAFGNDGALLETGTYEGSGWVVMRRYDPVTDTYSNIASPRQNSMLCASGDGSVIGYEESNISSGPVGKYDVAQQRITASSGTSAFNYEMAVDRRGRQFAALSGTIYLFDANLNLMPQLRSNALGVAYSPVAEALFVSVPATNRIRVYDSGDGFFGLRGQFTTAQNLTGGGSAYGTGRLKLSRDGQRVFVTTPSGIEWFTNNLVLFNYDWVRIEGAPFRISTPGPLGYGTNTVRRFFSITNNVPAFAEVGDIRYRADGADVANAIPVRSSVTQVVVQVTNDVDITWRWQEDSYRVTLLAAGSGTVMGATNGWYASNTAIAVTAQPADGFRFVRWFGAVSAAQQTSAAIVVTADRPLVLEAQFAATNDGAVTLAGDWPTLGRSAAHAGYVQGWLGRGRFLPKWTAALTGNVQQVAVGGGRVYATPNQTFGTAYLAALDEQTGAPLWHLPFTNCNSISPPTFDGGYVYVHRNNNADTQVWQIDAANGAPRWFTYHAAQLDRYQAPCVAADGVWVNQGSLGGLLGYAQLDGQERFLSDLPALSGWTPAYADGRLFTHVDGRLREHHPLNGVVLWTQAVTTGSSGTIALSDGAAFLNGSTNLHAMDLTTRLERWRVRGTFTRVPAVANGIVYASTATGVLAVTAGGGATVGFYPIAGPTEQPVVTDDALIVCSASETRIYDLHRFTLIQTIPVGGLPSLANGTLFIARSSGQVAAYAAVPVVRVVVGGTTANPSAGTPSPLAAGTNIVVEGTTITTGVTSPWPLGSGTQLVSLGWTGTGDVPAEGFVTGVTFTATSLVSTLTWRWQTNHYLTVNPPANGAIAPTSGWHAAGFNVALTATPAPNHHFVTWTGAATGIVLSAVVTMDAPRTVSAVFAPDLVASNVPAWWLAQHGLPTNDAAVYVDTDGDRVPNWLEYQSETDPTNRDSDGDGAWDGHELAYGSDPADPQIRPLDNRQPDYDGDGITDIALRQTRGRTVEIRRSSDGATIRWQTASRLSRVVVGDFDGDGISDLADFTPQNGQWRIEPSTAPGTTRRVAWGARDTIPVPADYDGDGTTDIAVYHPAAGNWHVLRSHDTNGAVRNWGWNGAIPVPADYDGDHGADFAVYDPATGNWHLRFSSTGSNAVVAWGWSEALPYPGDYDGDGMADLAVFHARLSTWHILGSETGAVRQQQWGAAGVFPAPGDFDGDGGTDLGYFNPANRTSYILPAAGTPWWVQWGRSGYEPVNRQALINRW